MQIGLNEGIGALAPFGTRQRRLSPAAMALRRAYLAELLKQHPPVLNELALSTLLDQSQK